MNVADNGPKLGAIIEGPCGRDAVHVAVAPVEAYEEMEPGTHVWLTPAGKAAYYAPGTAVEPVGIVDPFLTESVKQGERFYLFLYPNTVTSLRHVWTHPSFAVKVPSIKGEHND